MVNDSISNPSPIPGGWGVGWKFQTSKQALVFLVTSFYPEAIWGTSATDHLISMQKTLIIQGAQRLKDLCARN